MQFEVEVDCYAVGDVTMKTPSPLFNEIEQSKLRVFLISFFVLIIKNHYKIRHFALYSMLGDVFN